jgi:hypothetical protein
MICRVEPGDGKMIHFSRQLVAVRNNLFIIEQFVMAPYAVSDIRTAILFYDNGLLTTWTFSQQHNGY